MLCFSKLLAWNSNMMAGALAVILDLEDELKGKLDP